MLCRQRATYKPYRVDTKYLRIVAKDRTDPQKLGRPQVASVMDEPSRLAAGAYVELNPVRAPLVAAAHDGPWSSGWAHWAGKDDGFVVVGPLFAIDRRLACISRQRDAGRGTDEVAWAEVCQFSSVTRGTFLGRRPLVPPATPVKVLLWSCR